MSNDQRGKADDLEQRYVQEHAETEEVLTGLDPENTDGDHAQQVEAVGDDADQHVEAMARDDS